MADGELVDPSAAQRAQEAKEAAAKAQAEREEEERKLAEMPVYTPWEGTLQTEDDQYDLALHMSGAVPKEDKTKKVPFKTYNDRITATSLNESLWPQRQAALEDIMALGSTATLPPKEATAVVVGAGVAGLSVAQELTVTGVTDLIMLEKDKAIGGVWFSQANSYSRVNSSEPAYRLPGKPFASHKDTWTNHTPSHQITAQMKQLLLDFDLEKKLYKLCTVEAVKKRPGGKDGWFVEGSKQMAYYFATECKIVVMCTNRRLGTPRELSFKGEVRTRERTRGLPASGSARSPLGRPSPRSPVSSCAFQQPPRLALDSPGRLPRNDRARPQLGC